MKKYYDRLIEPYLKNLMKEFSAIAIDGLKGVGKTVSTKRIAATVFELDKPNDFDLITNIPDILISQPAPMLIDEWQSRITLHSHLPLRLLLESHCN